MKATLFRCALAVVLLLTLSMTVTALSGHVVTVQLQDSSGAPLSGGTVRVYSGGWKVLGTTDATGQVVATLDPGTYTFRMTYGSASIEKTQDVSGGAPVVFSTVAVRVELRDSSGNLGTLPSEGVVSYYASGWRSFGSTSGGVVNQELLPKSYTFRMAYGGASLEETQNVGSDGTVQFQTRAVQVALRDSAGNLGTLPGEGSVKYYAAGWRTFGTTSGGVISKELLPKSYAFRMTFEGASLEKTQNVSSDPLVVFGTVAVRVELRDSSGNLGTLPSEASVKHYAAGWRTFGATSGGVATKELLPKSYAFRMTYNGASLEKTQNVSIDPLVVFGTVAVRVELRDSHGNLGTLPSEGSVKHYASGWRTFGNTSGGVATRELLPKSYSFRMTYQGASLEKTQNVSSDPLVAFQTTSVRVEVYEIDGAEVPADGVNVKFYAAGWRTFGDTAAKAVTKELLPKGYTFRATHGNARDEKTQNVAIDPLVVFGAGPVDDEPPTVVIHAPADGGLYAGSTVPAPVFDASDPQGPVTVVEVGYSKDEGVHTYTVTATDGAGNSASASVSYTVDATAPMPPVVMGVTSAGLGAMPQPKLAEIELTGLAEDNARLQIWVQAPGEYEYTFVGNTVANECGHWRYTYSYGILGEHSIKIGARDEVGNWMWSDVLTLDLQGGQIETLVLQQGVDGYQGASDTWFASWPLDMHDDDTSLRLRPGAERGGQVRFDLGQIPANSQVLAANLGLYVTEASNAQPLDIDLYAPGNTWQAMDANTNPMDGLDAMGSGTLRGAKQWAGIEVTALTQDWVSDPSSNQGILIGSNQSGSVEYALASSEYPQECRRPLIAVIYSLEPDYVPSEPAHQTYLPLTISVPAELEPRR